MIHGFGPHFNLLKKLSPNDQILKQMLYRIVSLGRPIFTQTFMRISYVRSIIIMAFKWLVTFKIHSDQMWLYAYTWPNLVQPIIYVFIYISVLNVSSLKKRQDRSWLENVVIQTCRKTYTSRLNAVKYEKVVLDNWTTSTRS